MRIRSLDRSTPPSRQGGLFARAKRRDDHRLASLLARDSDLVLVLRGPVVTSASEGARQLLGWEPGLCVGRTLSELLESPEPSEARTIIDRLQDAAEAAGGHLATHRDLALTHLDGRTVWVDATIADLRHDPGVGGTIVTLQDVGERHALEERVRQTDFHDALTGLANRRMLRLLVEEEVRVPQHVGFMLVDLDRFSAINEAHGSTTGDLVLVAVAHRLASGLRSGDHVARISGDEFALFMRCLDPDAPERDARDVSERLARTLDAPVEVNGISVQVTASFSTIVHHTEHDGPLSSDSLLTEATDRLRQARRHAQPVAQTSPAR